MTKEVIKRLTKDKMRDLSNKWLRLIFSKPKQFGNASIRAQEVLAERGIKVKYT